MLPDGVQVMARYDFYCTDCGAEQPRIVAIKDRDSQVCECSSIMKRRLAKPYGRVFGRADGKPRPGGADQFTADAMGLNVKDLPIHMKEKGPGAV